MPNILSNNTHNRKILLRLFGNLSEDLMTRILDSGKILEVPTGSFLFRQGDPENSLYIVLTGRFRAIAEDEQGLHALGDIGEGEPIGEFALVMGEPRSASVVAIRKSTVLKLKEEQYLKIVSNHPEFSSKVTRFLVNRVRRNTLQKHLETTAKNIAVINLQEGTDLSDYTEAIKSELSSQHIRTQILDHDSHADLESHDIYNLLETHEGLNFLVCDGSDRNWSHQCVLYADLIIVATDFYAPKDIQPIEEQLELYSQNILNKNIYLLLLHPENAAFPQNTRHWMEKRKIDLHIHYRKNHGPDIRRFTRIISNKAIGLVLGGGGTKGYAHIGAINALIKEGVEIDVLGGTSAGALYGLTAAFCDFHLEKLAQYTRHAAVGKLTSNDFTFPVISFMSGKKVTDFVKRTMGNANLEDFWITSYCVSTNYSNATVKIHNTGLAWKQVQASIAIPGIYPPVVIDGQLHVDGGVVDNLPIEPMYSYPISHIIAISLTQLKSQPVKFSDTPDSKTILWDKITGRKKYRLPGLTSILVNSLTLNSRQKQEMSKSGVAIYLEMKLKGVGMLDDSKWKEIVEKGFEQMSETLARVPKSERFW